MMLTVIQGVLLANIYYEILWLFEPPHLHVSGEVSYTKEIGLVVGLLIMIFNLKRYRGNYSLYDQRWGNSETSRQSKLRGWLVVVALMVPLAIIFL
ncbi:hypothetical protein [Nibribacter koreensis]|uniref:hypothetical protein n=1 Tax=Nibribacter koreensis TaxID=1084519 RepID=UPI0031E8AF10